MVNRKLTVHTQLKLIWTVVIRFVSRIPLEQSKRFPLISWDKTRTLHKLLVNYKGIWAFYTNICIWAFYIINVDIDMDSLYSPYRNYR